MIHLDYRDARPIYAQICDGFREQIRTGILQAGEKLPSVRELAMAAGVNPNTVQKAYRMLEEEGLIQSHTGAKSCVVADEAARSRVRTQLLGQDARAMISAMKQMGVTREEALALLDTLWKEDDQA